MNDLVSIRRASTTQVTLAEIQERLDARKQIAETRSPVSTKKAMVEDAKRVFKIDPLTTLAEIMDRAVDLSEVFDPSITLDNVPLSREQINTLSDEYYELAQLQAQIAALETRYRELIFAHLDEVGPRIPGRPAAQVPGKVAAEGPGDHYIFERRGGNRENPDLDAVGLREVLPPELAAQIYVTVHHDAMTVDAWDEEVFDEGRFGQLVDEGKIDLDVVAPFLTPGKWRTPSFFKTLVNGVGHDS